MTSDLLFVSSPLLLPSFCTMIPVPVFVPMPALANANLVIGFPGSHISRSGWPQPIQYCLFSIPAGKLWLCHDLVYPSVLSRVRGFARSSSADRGSIPWHSWKDLNEHQ